MVTISLEVKGQPFVDGTNLTQMEDNMKFQGKNLVVYFEIIVPRC
jgi:hypothetical protein